MLVRSAFSALCGYRPKSCDSDSYVCIQGANGRPWIFVSSSEAFATYLGATCSCNGSHDMHCAPFYPPALIEVFSSMICAAALSKCQSQCSFSVPEAWSCIPVKKLDDSPHA